MRRCRISIGLFTLWLALLTVMAAVPGMAGPTAVTVKVALLPLQSWGPLFIADKEGFFAQQGIRIEWVPFAGACPSHHVSRLLAMGASGSSLTRPTFAHRRCIPNGEGRASGSFCWCI